MIIEIGIEVPDNQDDRIATLAHLEQQLVYLGIPFYIEPPSNKWVSLEDLECQCEGK